MQIGSWLALSSRLSSVVGLVVSDIAIMPAIGLAVGLAFGIAAWRLITRLAFEAKPVDIWSVTAPHVFLLLAWALAGLPTALWYE